MKRAFLIAGGTVGGLGAVLAITPPQLNTTTTAKSLGGTLGGSIGGTNSAAKATTVAATQAAAAPTHSATATKSPASKVSSKATSKATHSSSASASASASATQSQSAAPAASTPAASTPAASSGGYSGTITGATYAARNYGNLSATVTFKDGKITNVTASQSPTSWSQQSLSALLPYVNAGKITIEQIKQYSAETLPCAISNSCNSRASFTATAFWSSIKSAITKAGL